MSEEFNIKKFYKENKRKEEFAISQNTGLNIRHSFQPYHEGTDIEEVFIIKSLSNKECFGFEYYGSISYLYPKSQQESLLFIYDKSLMPVINELLEMSDYRLQAYGNHAPNLINAMDNAVKKNMTNIFVFLDEEMLCFAKQIDCPLVENIKKGYILEHNIIDDIVDLIKYRNVCYEEVVSFNGFSKGEKTKILFKEGLSLIKKGLRHVNIMDFIS